MGDSQPQGKKKGPYETWKERETKMLIRLLVEGIKQGWRDTSGCMSKQTVEKKILPALNSALNTEKTYAHYQSKWRNLKLHYNSMQELIRFSSGFGFDPITKKFTAPNHVWDDYEKAHPNKKNMRDETFEDYEDLHIIFDVGTATGKNAVGLGDETDAQTFSVEDNAPCELYTRLFGNMGKFDGSQASGSWDSTMPHSKGGPREKLPSKKRAKSGECGNSSNSNVDSGTMEKTFTEMIEATNRVVSVMQQREERQQREASSREAEKKKNNVWEAIKEISDLEENVRYDTLNEIHKLGMKDVFISMSIEERMGWIRRNVI